MTSSACSIDIWPSVTESSTEQIRSIYSAKSMVPPRPKTLKPRRNSIRATQHACHHLVIVTSSKYDVDTVPVPNQAIWKFANSVGRSPESKRGVHGHPISCSMRQTQL